LHATLQVGSQFLGTYAFDEEPFDWGNDDARKPHHLKVGICHMAASMYQFAILF